jgi:hypothetical protein
VVDLEERFTYQDFDLLIEARSPGSYQARVLRSPAGESGPALFTLPFSSLELENFLLKVSGGRQRTRGPGRPESAPLKEFGGKLYDAVFKGELREVLQRSISQTRAQGVGLRLRLRMTDTPELAQLPWEFLYDPRHNSFLAQSRRTPLVRYLDLPDPPRPLTVDGPLRLLVMISSPTGYPPLDVEREWTGLTTRALAQPRDEGRVIVERISANMSTLRRRLRREEFHIFHFVGHGHFHAGWGDGVLVMEDDEHRPYEVTGEELGGLLNEYDQPRLAVLNACEGARSGTNDPFAGVAQSMIQQGLPAVVAMQFEITDNAAVIFAHELYGAVADGFPLEAALANSRGAIRDAGNLTEWGTPVLYTRAPDGHLFDLADQGRASQDDGAARQEPESPRPAWPKDPAWRQQEANFTNAADKARNRFGGIFGQPRAQRGQDVETDITIPAVDAVIGTTVSLRLTSKGQCGSCRGTGARAGTSPTVCSACHGTGEAGGSLSSMLSKTACQTCGGRGLVVDDPCPGCFGGGRVTSSRTIRARVPAGIKDGQRIRLKGKGSPGKNGGVDGDLYVRVHVVRP